MGITDPRVSAFQPEENPVVLAILGKFAEELGECVQATARCIIQGWDENHPVSGKSNADWLLEEVADVLAGIELIKEFLQADEERLVARTAAKLLHKRTWHQKLRGDI